MMNWRPSGTDLTTGALITSPSSTIAMRSVPGRMSLVRAIILSLAVAVEGDVDRVRCWVEAFGCGDVGRAAVERDAAVEQKGLAVILRRRRPRSV